jgi:hypothetical protein
MLLESSVRSRSKDLEGGAELLLRVAHKHSAVLFALCNFASQGQCRTGGAERHPWLCCSEPIEDNEAYEVFYAIRANDTVKQLKELRSVHYWQGFLCSFNICCGSAVSKDRQISKCAILAFPAAPKESRRSGRRQFPWSVIEGSALIFNSAAAILHVRRAEPD